MLLLPVKVIPRLAILPLAFVALALGASETEARPPGTVRAGATIEMSISFVSGEITIWNNGRTDATVHDITGWLEVRFKRNAGPPESFATSPGSSPNWFKVADIFVDNPVVVPAKSTVVIPYSSPVCPAALLGAGASSMRSVVEIEASEGDRDGTAAAWAALKMPGGELIGFC